MNVDSDGKAEIENLFDLSDDKSTGSSEYRTGSAQITYRKMKTRKHKRVKTTKNTVYNYFDNVLNTTIYYASVRSKLVSYPNKNKNGDLISKNLQEKDLHK